MTPAVGANLHLDASGSTDPDGPIYRYSWDTDGDGKPDATGVTADVSYPTAGARAITLTVTDALGARSSRTQAVYVGGKTTPPGTPDVTVKLRASFSVPSGQKLKDVRKRGLLVRFSTNAPSTWTVKATHAKRTTKLHARRLRRAHGALASHDVPRPHRHGNAAAALPRARLAGVRRS